MTHKQKLQLTLTSALFFVIGFTLHLPLVEAVREMVEPLQWPIARAL